MFSKYHKTSRLVVGLGSWPTGGRAYGEVGATGQICFVWVTSAACVKTMKTGVITKKKNRGKIYESLAERFRPTRRPYANIVLLRLDLRWFCAESANV